MYETGKQIYKIERGEIANGEMLMHHRRFNKLLEVLRRRFFANKRFRHVPPYTGAALAPAEVQGVFLQDFWEKSMEIIMRN